MSQLIPPKPLRLGTRTSKLALWQTHHIIEHLQLAWHGLACEIVPFSTLGDKTQSEDKPLPEVGGKGLFTAELEEALRCGEIDLAVHSLKDLPVENAAGLTLGAITSRADVRDVLIARNGWTLATLPTGARVGTSSTRRAAQLRMLRPDLDIASIRGNIDTRIRKVTHGDYDATLLALAGLDRLGLKETISEILPLDVMLPAPGQGALAVQCRAADQSILRLLAAIDDPVTRATTTAERAFLAVLGSGCSAPVAAYARFDTNNKLFEMQALVANPDGSDIVRVANVHSISEEQLTERFATQFGVELAQKALANGADCILTNLGIAQGINQPLLPLRGKRIVITRRPEQAHDLISQLSELGATTLTLPVIEIVPIVDWREIDTAIEMLQSYDWLIFTSANAVEFFFQRLQATTNGQLSVPPIVVIGTATAQALAQFEIQPALIPPTATAEAIVETLNAQVIQAEEIQTKVGATLHGKKILLPQAAIARRNLAEALQSAGATVHAIAIYDTIVNEPSAQARNQLHSGVDGIIFTSGSTVRNFFDLVRKHNLEAAIQQSQIICIGPITAEEAKQQGFPATIIADEQNTHGLVNAILQHYTSTTQPQSGGL